MVVKIEWLQELLETRSTSQRRRRRNGDRSAATLVGERARDERRSVDRSGESDARGPLGPVSDEGHDRE